MKKQDQNHPQRAVPRLRLHRETLRQLSPTQLAGVGGGLDAGLSDPCGTSPTLNNQI